MGCLYAGVFAGVLIPLFLWLWTEGKSRMAAFAGLAGATAMVITSYSSTSLLAYGGSLVGLAFWPLRKQMRLVRWGFALTLVALHMVMKAPVWALIARVDLTGSSSGWHRYYLVDNCIRHFSDWWLLGYKYYNDWGWGMWDLCNQFVAVALTGGLVTLVFYVAIFSRSFGAIGTARKQVRRGPRAGMVSLVPGFSPVCQCGGAFGINYMAQMVMGLFSLAGLHFRGDLRGKAGDGSEAWRRRVRSSSHPLPARRVVCHGWRPDPLKKKRARSRPQGETMSDRNERVRVVYSFPLRLGADRICYTAWQQVNGLAAAGADLLVFPASLGRPVPRGCKFPRRWPEGNCASRTGSSARCGQCALHDHIVARRIEKLAGQIDIIHTWPLGALETLKTAARLGIPTVLERCNAHTGFAMEVVQKECDRLGVALPPDHEHAYNAEKLRKEEEEYRLATRLLCPSDFVVKTYLDKGYAREQLARHIYGYDETVYYPGSEPRDPKRGLSMLFVGVCAVRKGVHYALEAWLRSPASKDGTFLIAGEFLPAYREKLAPMLAHPSVKVLGHRNDVPELMRKSDILVLPSIEEGSALVTSDARASGCVLLVSEAAGAICQHMENALMHRVGDVEALTQHITMLHEDRALLERLRAASLRTVPEITWTAAGSKAP